MNHIKKTIEEKIFLINFPNEDFDWGDYYDWVNENPLEAYNMLLIFVKNNTL
jgi:hypothetical protein